MTGEDGELLASRLTELKLSAPIPTEELEVEN
jgi:hypothetical protein